MSITAARNRGFTLVELLVALFITAILFAIGYGAINQALTDRDAVRIRQDRVSEVQRAMRVLVQDFSQLAPRPVREPIGQGYQPALRSAEGTTDIVAFTRGGWANPAGVQRASLERVSYVLENNTLKRRHWPVLDSTLPDPPIVRDLLTNVRAVRLRFMGANRQWLTQWGTVASQAMRDRPIAVEITLDLADWGEVVRIVEVPG